MNTQRIKSAKVSLLILVLLGSSFHTFAQRPPTSGPNTFPEEESNLSPLVIVGGGIVVGAASYLYVKSRGPKLPVGVHLENYLLDRNILPTADAIGLMHVLNPSLSDKEVIRTKKKLVDPDFPPLPNDLLDSGSVLTSGALLSDLKAEVDEFRVGLAAFRAVKADIVSNAMNVGVDKIYPILGEIEKDVVTLDRDIEQGNSVKNQLITDLLNVLNQTLGRIVDDKILDDSDVMLIRGIAENLSELLYPEMSVGTSWKIIGEPDFKAFLERKAILGASVEPATMVDDGINPIAGGPSAPRVTGYAKQLNNTNLLKGFAFAVYLLNENGELITTGPEVEGKYLIKYVSPALKDFPDAYHNLLSPATYASAFLPPAKLFLVVETISGEQVPLQNPLIDFKVAFDNPQQEKLKELIIVPLYISR